MLTWKYVKKNYSKSELNELASNIYYLYITDNLTKDEVAKRLDCEFNVVRNIINQYYMKKDPEKINKARHRKVIEGNMRIYGVPNPMQNKEIAQKSRELQKKSNLEKYGVETNFQIPEVQEKRIQTIKERCSNKYGVEWPSQVPEYIEKANQARIKACNEKYGCDYYTQTREFVEKSQRTILEKYGNYTVFHLKKKDHIDIVSDSERLKEYIESIPFDLRDKSEICEFLGISISNLNWRLRTWKINDTVKFPKTSFHSSEEYSIIKMLESWGITNIIHGTREVIRNPETNYQLELDIYLPDHNLAIEYNGIIWHDKESQVRESLKTKLCLEKGIDLIHIWEDDWFNNSIYPNIIADLKSRLGITYSVVDSIDIVEVEDTPVYDIEVPEYNNFVLGNGLVVHNSVDTIQQFSAQGFNSYMLSVDRSRDPYTSLKNAVNEGRLIMPKIKLLEDEFADVEDHGQKIDHTSSGHKDILDTLAANTYKISQGYAPDISGNTAENFIAMNSQISLDDDEFDYDEWILPNGISIVNPF